jgi:hypothetical protein
MSEDTAPAFDIVEEHGSFLLIRAGSRFAVVERRAGRIYPMTRRLFTKLSGRGDRLARVLR